MTSTQSGYDAEEIAATYLHSKGYDIIARNWKTRWCEIDIIAYKDGVTYFTEVKYRTSTHWGDGFDYITPFKLRHMRFAAELYCAQHNVEVSSIMAAAVDAAGKVKLQEVAL